jgi:hypothetical protein
VSAICTLFEGNYHYGLAALVNSLHQNHFEGTIYAGYRGPLPPWAKACQTRGKVHVFKPSSSITLEFVPLQTEIHFTNYKPTFMLSLLSELSKEEELFYIDPDIVVSAPWSFFRHWVTCGVAVCEDVNSPLSEHHPRRVGWRSFYQRHGWQLKYRIPEQANGGFVGVTRAHSDFLSTWKTLLDLMVPAIGGLQQSAFDRTARTDGNSRMPFYFDRTDQDALNCAIEASAHPISILPASAMGFASGFTPLPHAVGQAKPWLKSYLMTWLRHGQRPSRADLAFWENVTGPVAPFSKGAIMRKKVIVKLASALSRFS